MTIKPSNFTLTPYYHGVYRCVRGAYIDGVDPYTNYDVSHRRRWFEERLALLQRHFCINVKAFAMGSCAYQIVLEVDNDKMCSMSDFEIYGHWKACYNQDSPVVESYLSGDTSVAGTALQILSTWQQRLADTGWFISALNQYIARKANEEDGQSGHFWDSSKLRPLLDEKAKNKALSIVDNFAVELSAAS